MQFIIMILGVFFLVGLYAFGMYLNEKMPTPEECDTSFGCESCSSTTCSLSKNNQIEEIKSEIKKDLHQST